MGILKRLIDKARKEYRDTLKAKNKSLKDATGRTLGQELVHEAIVLTNVALKASQGLLNVSGTSVATAILSNLGKEGKEMNINELLVLVKPMVYKAVEKSLKTAVQAVVTTLLAIVSNQAVADGLSIDPLQAHVVLTALIYGGLEVVRTTVKRVLIKKKLTTLASLL